MQMNPTCAPYANKPLKGNPPGSQPLCAPPPPGSRGRRQRCTACFYYCTISKSSTKSSVKMAPSPPPNLCIKNPTAPIPGEGGTGRGLRAPKPPRLHHPQPPGAPARARSPSHPAPAAPSIPTATPNPSQEQPNPLKAAGCPPSRQLPGTKSTQGSVGGSQGLVGVTGVPKEHLIGIA